MKERFGLSRTIELKAAELGFKLFGITSPTSPENYSIFEKWLARIPYGDMQYLDTQSSRQKRCNPIQMFPECKSIISVGLPYDAADNYQSNLWKVARFSQKSDYHQVIREKLNLLLEFVICTTDVKTKGRIYCDTSPVLEKELAQRAGLGNIGKNSLLISPENGSFFNLGELFLNIELPFSQAYENDPCIGCNQCLLACPTKCIGNDRTIKANQCISYLTIEHKGIIPKELRPLMNSWIYGCDICQLVCPWNQKAIQASTVSHYSDDHDLLKEFIPISELWSFLKSGEDSIILNRGAKQKILRNYAISLGNTHNYEVISGLKNLFFEEEPGIRAAAAWALGQIHNQDCQDFLKSELKKEKQETVITEILEVLTQ
jgi:epoxyqueuosine reductase